MRSAANTDRPVEQDGGLRDIDLQALVDGELDHDQEQQIRALLLQDPAARARYRELLEQKRLLLAWWKQFS